MMGISKRKEERSETVTVRVPASVKAELEELREETGAARVRSKRDAVGCSDAGLRDRSVTS